jgi:hypothetical protein
MFITRLISNWLSEFGTKVVDGIVLVSRPIGDGFDPHRPYQHPPDWSGLSKKRGGIRGQITSMIRFVRNFSAARVTTGFEAKEVTAEIRLCFS